MVDLPRLMLLTDRVAATGRGRSLKETVRLSVLGGATAVLLREKDLPSAHRQRLSCELAPLLGGGRLGIASDVDLAAEQPRPWVHLAQRDAMFDRSFEAMVGRSCHNAQEVRRARIEGCDYVTVSPVELTASKPGYGPALGEAGLRAIADEAGVMPFWVLGGVTPNNVERWVTAGARGVAVMGGVMGAPDPADATSSYLHALGAHR